MLEAIFPKTEFWDWKTFIIYTLVGLAVILLCRSAAKSRGILKNNTDANIKYFIAITTLVLLASLRSEDVCPDTKVYIELFEEIKRFEFDWSELFEFRQMEPGFQMYSLLVSRISKDYTVFFFITYSFLAMAYISFIRRYLNEKSFYMPFLLIIYFYISNISGIRAALGTVFLIYSYMAMEDKKYLKAIVLTFLGCTFHYTMMFNFYVIIFTYLFRKDFMKSNRIVWILLTVLMVMVSNAGVYYLKGIFADTKYNHYSSVSMEDLSIIGSLVYVAFGVLCLIFYKKLYKKNANLLTISMSMLVVYPVLYVIAAYRIPDYYALPRLVIWSNICETVIDNENDTNHRTFIKVAIGVLVVLYLLIRFINMSANGSFEYELRSF